MDDVLERMMSGPTKGREEAIFEAGHIIDRNTLTYKSSRQLREVFSGKISETEILRRRNASDIRALTDALIKLARDEPELAPAAAFALRNSMRRDALPVLAKRLIEWAPRDSHAALQAVVAISDIITLGIPAGGLAEEQVASLVRDGIHALRFAAQYAPEAQGGADGYEVRRTASDALETIDRHLSSHADNT